MVDQQGFRALLETRKVSDEKIEAAIALVERFEQFAEEKSATPIVETAWAFSERLIAEGQNTEDNYLALARYGVFTKNNALFVAILELLDGAEAQGNLYRRVAEMFGEDMRDEVFAGISVAPLGLPTPDKPRTMHPVVERLEAKLGTNACKALLADSLRDLPDEYFAQERQRYQESADLDEYLRRKKQVFVEQLETCQREGRLFFAQEITDEVIAFVKNDPEIGGGRREGNVVFETKIPFMTSAYLAETDPTLRRYFYCHCPWAREAIKSGDVSLTATFCNCSAGFHKKPWEVTLGKPVRAEVLESVLKGDDRCRFAIYLPLEV
ncbi:MAG TPA: hypothetical protein PKZ84_09305 [Anaerolineae bacterium]|nr:hypothetical protein [Anaerolineae bacterium]HQI84754.1 hypothetical protein [Anaerolineae bacterium]